MVRVPDASHDISEKPEQHDGESCCISWLVRARMEARKLSAPLLDCRPARTQDEKLCSHAELVIPLGPRTLLARTVTSKHGERRFS